MIITLLIALSNGIKVRVCFRDVLGYCSTIHGLESRVPGDDNAIMRTHDNEFFVAVDPSTTLTGEEFIGRAPSENHFLRGIAVSIDQDTANRINLAGIFVDVTNGSEEDVLVKEESEATEEITRLECDPG